MSDPYCDLDATSQAELVRRKQASPRELVDAAIARIEKLNPEINAVIIPLFEKARALADSPDLPDGPFRGVPFLLKDLASGTRAGDPIHWGTRFLKAELRAEMGLGQLGETIPAEAGGTAAADTVGATSKISFSPQADAPSCSDCGSIMVRNGSCYKCLNCGTTSGCS